MDLNEIVKDFKSLRKINWQRNWEPFLKKYQCDFVCELGVYRGDNFLQMIKHNPKLAVAVDAWRDNGQHPRKYDDYDQKEFDIQYEYFKSRVTGKPFVQIVRDYTVKAAEQFLDNYFDFVYIDADHSEEACYADIQAWYPKVKKGKFLAGHDYRKGFGVVEAVNRFVKENNLQLIFLAPSNWMIIKPHP